MPKVAEITDIMDTLDPNARLSQDTKKFMLQVAEDEFKAKRSLFDQDVKQRRDKILAEHKKKVKFKEVSERRIKLEEQLHEIGSEQQKERRKLMDDQAKERRDMENDHRSNLKSLEKDHAKATKRLNKSLSDIRTKLRDAGLTIAGELIHVDPVHGDYYDEITRRNEKAPVELRRAISSIKEKFAVIDRNAPSVNMMNKVKLLIQMSERNAQGLVIMKAVMGNGILPDVPKSTLRAITADAGK